MPRPTRSVSRFIPRLDTLGDRAMPSVTYEPPVDGVLTIQGDRKANEITITDDGTAISIAIDGGESVPVDGTVTEIRVIGGGGADEVTYNLTGDLAGERIVSADLGNGNDSFWAELDGNLLAGAALTLEALGKNGQDTLGVDASGDVADGATLAVDFAGGNGKDNLAVIYSGVLVGSATFDVDGGNGKDKLGGSVALADGSTGSLVAHWVGGNGVDDGGVSVDGTDLLAALDASVDGGRGKDKFQLSGEVVDVEAPAPV